MGWKLKGGLEGREGTSPRPRLKHRGTGKLREADCHFNYRQCLNSLSESAWEMAPEVWLVHRVGHLLPGFLVEERNGHWPFLRPASHTPCSPRSGPQRRRANSCPSAWVGQGSPASFFGPLPGLKDFSLTYKRDQNTK